MSAWPWPWASARLLREPARATTGGARRDLACACTPQKGSRDFDTCHSLGRADGMLLSLPADTLLLVLLPCDFDSLRAVLAASRQLRGAVLATLRASAWRRRRENEHALQRATWAAGEVTEACLGAFCGAVREVSLDGASAVACSGLHLKVWDADAASCSHSYAVDGRVEQVALRGSLVAYVSHYYTRVRLLDLASGRQRTLHGVEGRALSLTWAAQHLVLFVQPGSDDESARCRRWIRVFKVPLTNAMDEAIVELAAARLRPVNPADLDGPFTPNVHVAVHGRYLAAFNSQLSIELLSYPDLQHVRMLRFPSPAPAVRVSMYDRVLAMGEHTLVLGAASPKGILHLWDLSDDQLCTDPARTRLEPMAPARSWEPLQPAGRWPRTVSVSAIAMDRGVLAACVGRRGVNRSSEMCVVCVWDVVSGDQLREVELPSRTHAFFHRNVAVPHSLSEFGLRLDLQGSRIVLTARVQEGDWTEALQDGQPLVPPSSSSSDDSSTSAASRVPAPTANLRASATYAAGPSSVGRATRHSLLAAQKASQKAGSLLIVQEFGPEWLRTAY